MLLPLATRLTPCPQHGVFFRLGSIPMPRSAKARAGTKPPDHGKLSRVPLTNYRDTATCLADTPADEERQLPPTIWRTTCYLRSGFTLTPPGPHANTRPRCSLGCATRLPNLNAGWRSRSRCAHFDPTRFRLHRPSRLQHHLNPAVGLAAFGGQVGSNWRQIPVAFRLDALRRYVVHPD